MTRKITPHPKPKKAKHFIREWRKHRSLTQEQLAARIEATSGAISQLENGVINYTQPTLEALAYALSCSPGDLLSVDPTKQGEVIDLLALLRAASPEKQEEVTRVLGALLRTGTAG